MDKSRVIETLKGVAEERLHPGALYGILSHVEAMLEPLPERKRGMEPKYPYDTVEVGQWFDIPVGPDQPKLASVRVYAAIRGRDLNRRFMVHQYPDGLIQVYRKA